MDARRSGPGAAMLRDAAGACSHMRRRCACLRTHDGHTPTRMPDRARYGPTRGGEPQSRIRASDSEWNSRWYRIQTTPALPSAKASGENSQAAAAKAK